MYESWVNNTHERMFLMQGNVEHQLTAPIVEQRISGPWHGPQSPTDQIEASMDLQVNSNQTCLSLFWIFYPLVNVYIAMVKITSFHGNIMKHPLEMGMFNSYVCLPEGNCWMISGMGQQPATGGVSKCQPTMTFSVCGAYMLPSGD